MHLLTYISDGLLLILYIWYSFLVSLMDDIGNLFTLLHANCLKDLDHANGTGPRNSGSTPCKHCEHHANKL